MNKWEKIPYGFDESALKRRRQWMKEQGLNWESCSPELSGSMRGLIENHIGQIAIPLALAGPCVIDGTYAQGTYYMPVATLEGTLTLSMSRGFYATAQCGGIQTQHIQQMISRSPIFSFKDLNSLKVFSTWVTEHFNTIKNAEAAGQNMTTFCTHNACEFIRGTLAEHLSFTYLLESSFNADKKPSTKTLLAGRGHKVIASCVLSAAVCKRTLGISPRQLAEGMRVARYASTLANIVGINLHVANALTAIYLATGQDCACVSENAVAFFDILYLPESDEAKCVLTMPSITVGTVGSGMQLPQQQSNLKLINCVGKHSSKRLAELITASALALEISLAAAIGANKFAKAHMIFGRKKKKRKVHEKI
ncbi:hydroxymethylglutaryl-CoA reductase [Coxiella burnetii]|uniref:3-hydroxy-3-methylglutaryl-coenzyme A reductase n=1 Tax=Coxiella burnetii (strain Dugway 5J108-111) TaxID=434922 RepID=A9KBD5_COXBN|nr:hydroxymethylglutaryl-CoA reductase [Coxiella burnetii]ABS77057.1 3-hydroxy-3-methylglutaryl-coenzyme A reductase [Coxiella burnetii Dugway 5J108-111]OYK81208.1 hydroxymethylglutaryl-CoA reductase [Coxiella burnetii]OYK83298.1 hydroxymethylglutaryl-CoA reductase [Coxiella burnetii]